MSSCRVGAPVFLFSLADFQVKVGVLAPRLAEEIPEDTEDMSNDLHSQTTNRAKDTDATIPLPLPLNNRLDSLSHSLSIVGAHGALAA